MNLSFIPWYILCTLTCGLGYIYVAPYLEATNALYYENFRIRALQEGRITEDDFLSDNQIRAKYANFYANQMEHKTAILISKTAILISRTAISQTISSIIISKTQIRIIMLSRTDRITLPQQNAYQPNQQQGYAPNPNASYAPPQQSQQPAEHNGTADVEETIKQAETEQSKTNGNKRSLGNKSRGLE